MQPCNTSAQAIAVSTANHKSFKNTSVHPPGCKASSTFVPCDDKLVAKFLCLVCAGNVIEIGYDKVKEVRSTNRAFGLWGKADLSTMLSHIHHA